MNSKTKALKKKDEMKHMARAFRAGERTLMHKLPVVGGKETKFGFKKGKMVMQ